MFTLVKLNAINSTNSYLKDWAKQSELKNATVVVAESQTKGRGQQKANWVSEPGKNLTFSLLYRFKALSITNQFYLNCAVSLAVYSALSGIVKKDLKIKWPNDIMSADKKICGILIENTVKSSLISQSVIGIGLNVNQINFPEHLPKASSLSLITNQIFDLDSLLQTILKALAKNLNRIENGDFFKINQDYQNLLYQKDVWASYSDGKNDFKGLIKGVNLDGMLELALENGIVTTFSNKTISYL